jgi:phenylacetate-CoA ligase
LRLKLKLKAIDIYGLSEVVGPGVSCECEYQAGMHINEDHFIPEIIDPETLEPLPPGNWANWCFQQ